MKIRTLIFGHHRYCPCISCKQYDTGRGGQEVQSHTSSRTKAYVRGEVAATKTKRAKVEREDSATITGGSEVYGYRYA